MRRRFRLCLGYASALALVSAPVACTGALRSERPAVILTRIPPADEGGPFRPDIIEGRVAGARPGQQIVLFARSGSWWVQPLEANPFTSVEPDSRWTNSTHLGTEYAALLVEPGYRPPARTESLPPVGAGVVAVAAAKGSRFWAASWFRLALVTLGALAVLGLYRARMRRLTKELEVRFEERLAERTRLAQELHDTLLQGFVSVSLQLHVALDQLPEGAPSKPLLDRVAQVVGQVIEEGRHTVRGLRSPASDPHDLEQVFAKIGEEIPADAGVSLRVVVTGTARALRPILRDEVYRIGRESLVNASRHAGPARIEAELAYEDDGLRVVVRDDGRGIDPQKLGGRDDGGLCLMRNRAEAIGARLEVRSRPGAGTEVVLFVPARIGFDVQPPKRPRLLGAWLGGLLAVNSDRETGGPIR
jgi:signal transduction histidine kinase